MNGLKEAFSRENLLKDLNFFALLNLGLVLTAVGIVYFKNPNHFAFGGTSGLSILLADLFPRINVGGFMWIINLVLVVLGFIFWASSAWAGRSTPPLHSPFSCPAASGCTLRRVPERRCHAGSGVRGVPARTGRCHRV